MKKFYLFLFAILFAAGTFAQTNKVMVVSALAPDDATDFGRVQKFMDSLGVMEGINLEHVLMADMVAFDAAGYAAYDAAIITENGGSSSMRAFNSAGWLIPAVFLKAYALHGGDHPLITNEATMWYTTTKSIDLPVGINEMVVKDNSDVLKCYTVDQVVTWTGGYDTQGTDGATEAHVQGHDLKSSAIADIVSNSTALAANKNLVDDINAADNVKNFMWKVEENSATKRLVTMGVHHGFMELTTPDFWNIMRSSLRWVLKQDYTCPGQVGVKDAIIRPYQMYPNPVADQLNFRNAANISNIDIIDMTGKVLISVQNDSRMSLLVNTTSLAKGMYFVRVNTMDGQTYSDKLVK